MASVETASTSRAVSNQHSNRKDALLPAVIIDGELPQTSTLANRMRELATRTVARLKYGSHGGCCFNPLLYQLYAHELDQLALPVARPGVKTGSDNPTTRMQTDFLGILLFWSA
jgi:hypothetical protein